MADEKRIRFTGVDEGVSSMMKKIRADAESLSKDMLRDAQEQTKSVREQSRMIEDQIRSIERRNRLDLEASKFTLAKRREQGVISEEQFKGGIAETSLGFQSDKIQTSILRDMLEELKETNEESENAKAESFLNSLILNDLLRDVGGLLKGTATAKTEFDLITPFTSIVGAGLGATLGAGIETALGIKAAGFGIGEVDYAIIGAEIGAQIGEFAGEAIERHIASMEAFEEAGFALRGVTGIQPLHQDSRFLSDMVQFGFDMTEAIKLIGETVDALGTTQQFNQQAQDVAILQRGLGFRPDLINQQLRIQRMVVPGAGTALDQVSIAFEAALKEGLITEEDRTLFKEIISAQLDAATMFSETAEMVDPNVALKTILELNRVGGMFATRDPRSAANMKALQQDLGTPQNDFVRAHSFMLLREMMPKAGLFDIMEAQQAGMQTPELLAKTVQSIVSLAGPDKQLQLLTLAERFPSLKLPAVRRLHGMRDMLGTLTPEEIEGEFTGLISERKQDLREKAVSNISALEIARADVENAFIKGAMDGVLTVTERFGHLITAKFVEAIETSAKTLVQQLKGTNEVVAAEPEGVFGHFKKIVGQIGTRRPTH